MKKIKVLSLLLIASAVCFLARGQTTQNLYLRNANNNLFRYGFQAIATTTDSAVHLLSVLPIGSNEAGILEVQVAAFDSANKKGITGSKIVRYVKASGTLTLGTATNVLATVVDSGLSPSAWSIDTASNNIVVKINGKLGDTLRWIGNARWIMRQ